MTLLSRLTGEGRVLSRNRYRAGGRTFHLRDVLVLRERGDGMGVEADTPPGRVAGTVSAALEGTVSPERIVVLRRSPHVLALILELQPGVHPEGDLTLEEVAQRFRGTVRFLRRGLTLPVTPKREGERVRPYRSAPEPTATTDRPGPPRLVFHFSKVEVGMGDRMVGLASTMVLARALGGSVVLDRPFLPGVFETATTEGPPAPVPYDVDFLDTRFRYHERFRVGDFSDLGGDVHVIGNECCHYGLYENPHVRDRLGSFDDDLREAYREIFRTVLRPRSHVRDAVERVVSSAEGRTLVGLQLRTGMLEREFPMHSRQDVVRYCRSLVRALPGALDRYLAFVTADHTEMAELARATLEDLGLATCGVDAPVLHVSYTTHRESASAQEKLVVDLLVLAECAYLFFSFHSNFGRIAYMLGHARAAYGLYGRNFDLIPLEHAYVASSKHLVYNDAVGAALGGLLRLRYYGEVDRLGLVAMVARTLPGFSRAMLRTALKRGWVPLREGLRLFMEALHAVEESRSPE